MCNRRHAEEAEQQSSVRLTGAEHFLTCRNDTAQRLASDECMIHEISESLKMTISYRKTPQGVVQDL